MADDDVFPPGFFDRMDPAPDAGFYGPPRLVTHIDECTTGDGILDHDTFMRQMEALGPDRYLIVEHCSVEDIPRAKAFLDRKAQELGIRVY